MRSATDGAVPGAARTRDLRSVPDELTPARARTDAEDLAGAVRGLAPDGAVDLCLRPGAIDVTNVVADGAVWETVSVPANVAGVMTDARRRTSVGAGPLLAALGDPGTTEVRIARNGAMTVGDLVLTPAPRTNPEPPRPRASGVLRERLTLPRSATGLEMVLRLDGPNVLIPEHVRERFAQRRVTSVSLFERAGDWFISGVRNDTPTLILVGAVGVY